MFGLFPCCTCSFFFVSSWLDKYPHRGTGSWHFVSRFKSCLLKVRIFCAPSLIPTLQCCSLKPTAKPQACKESTNGLVLQMSPVNYSPSLRNSEGQKSYSWLHMPPGGASLPRSLLGRSHAELTAICVVRVLIVQMTVRLPGKIGTAQGTVVLD